MSARMMTHYVGDACPGGHEEESMKADKADATVKDLSRALEYITRVSWILRRVINELDDEGATREITEAALLKVDLAGQSVEDEIAVLRKWGLS